jgi:hypothetical protein
MSQICPFLTDCVRLPKVILSHPLLIFLLNYPPLFISRFLLFLAPALAAMNSMSTKPSYFQSSTIYSDHGANSSTSRSNGEVFPENPLASSKSFRNSRETKIEDAGGSDAVTDCLTTRIGRMQDSQDFLMVPHFHPNNIAQVLYHLIFIFFGFFFQMFFHSPLLNSE